MQELVQAIDLALANEWERAHKIVQGIKDEGAYWIHAVLHKIEGDRSNSMYWYSRAGKTEHFGMDSAQELRIIRQALVGTVK